MFPFKDASLFFEFALDLLHPNKHIATSPSKTILTMGTPLPHSFLSNHKIYSTEKHTLSSRTKFFLSLFFLEYIHTNLDMTLSALNFLILDKRDCEIDNVAASQTTLSADPGVCCKLF